MSEPGCRKRTIIAELVSGMQARGPGQSHGGSIRPDGSSTNPLAVTNSCPVARLVPSKLFCDPLLPGVTVTWDRNTSCSLISPIDDQHVDVGAKTPALKGSTGSDDADFSHGVMARCLSEGPRAANASNSLLTGGSPHWNTQTRLVQTWRRSRSSVAARHVFPEFPFLNQPSL